MLSVVTQLAAEEKTGVAVLGLDIKAILLQAGVFLLLFFIVKKFALTGIVKTLDERRKTIDKGVSLGLEMEKDKEAFDEQSKELLHAARAKADEIVAQAHTSAGEIIKQGELDAASKIDDMLKNAHEQIEHDIQEARVALRKEMLEHIAAATEVIIDEKVDARKDESLIERALKRARS